MVDTHCHLTFPDFRGRLDRTIAEAAEHGVDALITISTTTVDCLDALAIAEAHANVWCSAGVHPLHAHEGPHDWQNLRRVASSARCVAWGELGLDNHYDTPAADIQRSVLDEQLAFIASCREGRPGVPTVEKSISTPIDKPIILHCREAFSDLIGVLRSAGVDGSRCVFHCFTGGPADALLALDFGGMISFTGVVTYRNAAEVRDAARLVPLDRIMVETDAPFLSPEPHRGERPCKPWMASLTARRLAEVRGEEWRAFHEAINVNTRRFFGVPV